MDTKIYELTSPTYGKLNIDKMVDIIHIYLNKELDADYDFCIGTDSQAHDGYTRVVTVLTVHRKGKGGIFFYHIENVDTFRDLRSKIYFETNQSLEFAKKFTDSMLNHEIFYDVCLHVDIGKCGKTKDLINEISGLVKAYGYDVLIKPESYAASSISDRLTK